MSRKMLAPSPRVIRPAASTTVTSPTWRCDILTLTNLDPPRDSLDLANWPWPGTSPSALPSPWAVREAPETRPRKRGSKATRGRTGVADFLRPADPALNSDQNRRLRRQSQWSTDLAPWSPIDEPFCARYSDCREPRHLPCFPEPPSPVGADRPHGSRSPAQPPIPPFPPLPRCPGSNRAVFCVLP